MNNKIKVFLFVVIVGIAGVFLYKNYSPKSPVQYSPTPAVIPSNQNDSPKIISTKPEPLNEAIISTTDTLEITFNRPLENAGEFKSRIEPKIDYKVELSQDRKTAKITFTKPLDLDTTFTLFIGPESKFDGVGRWGQEKVFHFRTIKYRGV